MVRQKIMYYKMLTPERRAEIQAKMRVTEKHRTVKEASCAAKLTMMEEKEELS